MKIGRYFKQKRRQDVLISCFEVVKKFAVFCSIMMFIASRRTCKMGVGSETFYQGAVEIANAVTTKPNVKRAYKHL